MLHSIQFVIETIKNPQTKHLALRSAFEFGIRDQDLEAILVEVNRHYRPRIKFPRYGQFDCDLVLLRRIHPR